MCVPLKSPDQWEKGVGASPGTAEGRKSLAPTHLSLFPSSGTILVMKTSFSHRNCIHFFQHFLFLPVPAAFRHPLTNATNDVGQTVPEINALIILLSHTNNVGGALKTERPSLLF